MKKMTIVISAIVIGMMITNTAMAGRVGKRQVRQQKRIHQGVKSGELTGREAYRLEREQHRLQRAKRRAWSDGELTNREKLRLEHKQNKASRHIRRAKHNDRKRN